MRIAGHITRSINVPGGSRLAMMDLLDALKDRGHDCILIDARRNVRNTYHWADVIIAQHMAATEASLLGRVYHVPWLFYAHNRHQTRRCKNAAAVIYNSHFVMDNDSWSGKRLLLYPQYALGRYRTAPGHGIMLVNPSEEKGAELFYSVARLMPDREFIGVVGRNAPWQRNRAPSNVRFVGPFPSDRMSEAYGLCRLLLIPSKRGRSGWQETWGRIGIEAAASGIPSIGSDIPALRESLGDCGTFPEYTAEAWVEAIRRFDDAEHYAAMSQKTLVRAAEVEAAIHEQVTEIERFMQKLVKEPHEHIAPEKPVIQKQRVVIMAAGSGARWQNYLGVPKQLAPVDGEPLIHRTIRQLRERGITDIYVTVRQYGALGQLPGGVTEYVKPFNDYEIDRVYGAKDLVPCLFLYGDACYTDRAMDIILSDTHPYRFFGSSRPNGVKLWREMYAIKADAWLIAKCGELREMFRTGKLRRCIGQDLHYYVAGVPIKGNRFQSVACSFSDDHYTALNDGTSDFDTPKDYDRWCKRYNGGRSFK